MEKLNSSTDVLIAGAGPTGLALACVLAENGISFRIVDKLAQGANTSRAAVIQARTLETLEDTGVIEKLLNAGRPVPAITLYDSRCPLTTIRFDHLPSRYPYLLIIPQNLTESILLHRLQELGGKVSRPCTVTQLSQSPEAVRVTVSGEGPDPQIVEARYVVGADGMHSEVREQAGIVFPGGSYQHSFVLADVQINPPLSTEEVKLQLSPDGPVILVPLPGEQYRIVAMVAHAPEHPGITDIQKIMDRWPSLGVRPAIREIVWSSRFHIHHRLAGSYRSGRIFVAGDAAHVHSPAGGQGMNTGIQDALCLGSLLKQVLKDGAPPEHLDHYERRRRPVGQHVVRLTDRMTRMATLQNRWACHLRNAVIRNAGRFPAIQRKMALEISELWTR